MLNVITSVPAVAGVALATTTLLIRDMLEGERMRSTSGNRRRRSYGLVCALILLALVVLRFVTLAG